MVTQASQWKSKSKAQTYPLPLPSDNTCLVRPLKPEALLNSGMIPDPLASLIQEAVNSKRGLPPQKLQQFANDPSKLAAALEMFDRVLVYCVVEPPVEMPPACTVEGCGELENGGEGVHQDRKHKDFHRFQEAERDPNVLYADEVDMEDKQFIMQWAMGGHSDVERFRKELAAAVGSVQPS